MNTFPVDLLSPSPLHPILELAKALHPNSKFAQPQPNDPSATIEKGQVIVASVPPNDPFRRCFRFQVSVAARRLAAASSKPTIQSDLDQMFRIANNLCEIRTIELMSGSEQIPFEEASISKDWKMLAKPVGKKLPALTNTWLPEKFRRSSRFTAWGYFEHVLDEYAFSQSPVFTEPCPIPIPIEAPICELPNIGKHMVILLDYIRPRRELLLQMLTQRGEDISNEERLFFGHMNAHSRVAGEILSAVVLRALRESRHELLKGPKAKVTLIGQNWQIGFPPQSVIAVVRKMTGM